MQNKRQNTLIPSLMAINIYTGCTDTETEAGLGDIIASVKYAGIYRNIQLDL